jgi:hypothetical protein
MADIRVERAAEWISSADVGDHRTWIERLARLGFAAKGIVYLVIGTLALRAALGRGGGTTDSRGALHIIGDGAFGNIALGIIGVGLLGYTVWGILSAIKDTEGRGREAKGLAIRIGQAGRAIAYGLLGVAALKLLIGAGGGRSDGAQHWTARLLQAPAGKWLVVGVGLGIGAYALYQFYRASAKNIRKKLDLSSASASVARSIERLGRLGIAARGVVFALIAWFLVRAGMRYDPSQAGGIGDSLASLRTQSNGALLLGVVAAGLIAYGLFQFANARYRKIQVT